jgi:hypothetical protein
MVDVPLMRAVFRAFRGGVFRASGDRSITCCRNFIAYRNPIRVAQRNRRRCRGRAEAGRCGGSTAGSDRHILHTQSAKVSDLLVEQQINPSKARSRSTGQVVVAGNDRPGCPMASTLSWIDMYDLVTKNSLLGTVAGSLWQTAELTNGLHATAETSEN